MSATSKQIMMIYLQKMDNEVEIRSEIGYDHIYLDLNVLAEGERTKRKIPTYVEDQETCDMLKAILGKRFIELNVIVAKLSCDNLIELASHKIPAFNAPFSLVVVDGDVRAKSSAMRNVHKANNILLLPGHQSPEREVADYIYHLSDRDPLWGKLSRGYSNQVCFRNYSYDDIMNDRVKAKEWFRAQVDGKWWGRSGGKVLKAYMDSKASDVEMFIKEYEEKLKLFM